MLEAFVRYSTGEPVNQLGDCCSTQFTIGPLELVELFARRSGFDDVDVEPMDNYVRITCRGKKADRSVSVRGSTIDEACEKLLEIIK